MSASPNSTPRSPFRSDLLASHVVLITGGGSGIGLEIARQLGLHGAAIVIMGRRQAVLTSAAEWLTAAGVKCGHVSGDVRKMEDCKRVAEEAVKQFGRLDILVNCAAGNFLCPAEDLSSNGFRTVLDIDTLGTFNMCSAAFPHLRSSPNASIINISATLHLYATHWQAHASAAKAAVDSLTRSLALEWSPLHIRVNGVAPGPIADTAGAMKLISSDKSGAGGKGDSRIAEMIPLGVMGEKWDIAIMVLFLVGEGGRWVSGQTVVVDGGALVWRPPWAKKEEVRAFAKAIETKSRKEGVAKAKL